MLQKIKEMKKKKRTAVITICSFLAITFGVTHYINNDLPKDSEEIFTQVELEALREFENQTITLGFSRGSELGFRYALRDLLQEELNINIEFIRYDTYEEVEAAAIAGEVDILINLKEAPESEELQWVSSPLTNNQYVITNTNNPLGEAINLQNSKVGFVTGSVLYRDLKETLGVENFEMYFYDEIPDVLDALENGEIDAFITRIDTVSDTLVNRKNAQIEFVFQNKILTGRFGTADHEICEALEIFGEIMNSSRADALAERLAVNNTRHIEDVISAYLQKEYPEVIQAYDVIKVGMHNANFPFSFFDENGTPLGIYLEMMNLFRNTTGIDYEIKNTREHTHFDDLFMQLENNEIQFLLGLSEEPESSQMTRVGWVEEQDNIISIQKFGSNTEMRGLADLTFGMVTTDEYADQILGLNDSVRFRTYEEAITALYQQEIDILIGRETVLSFYRDVLGMTFLNQTSHINRISSHSILGHVENEGINGIMADIQRLYHLVYPGNQDKRWTNKAMNFQNMYNELRQQQRVMYFVVIGLSGIIFVTWILTKELDNRKLRKANERDPLTKLYKKGVYERKCKELIEKNPDKLGAFFFIDLDDFKSVNDTYGHEVGDIMIMEFGEILKKVEAKIPNTIAFRIAGDEFGIFTIGYDTRNEIQQLITNMRTQVRGEVLADKTSVLPIKYSVGGSIYNLDTISFENLKNYADLAMYKAKKGKGFEEAHVEMFDTMLLYESYKEAITDSLIDTVLKERQIHAVYQPIYALNNEDIYGYEGLSRTHNQNVKNIMELIELAEKAGKRQELDLLMMEQIILGFGGKGQLFINMMSTSEEAINTYLEKMIQTAEKSGLPVEQITIELSERTEWSKESLKIICKFKNEHGFQLAIDDFGVGFSNSALVLDVQPNIVKIDRYLIQEIYKNKGKYAFVKSFIETMKASEMKIACEGIEEKEELEILKKLGSDYGQGYYLGKPQ